MCKVNEFKAATLNSLLGDPGRSLDSYLLLQEIQRSISIDLVDRELYDSCIDLIEKLRHCFLRDYLYSLDSGVFARGAMSGIHEMVEDRMQIKAPAHEYADEKALTE